MQSRCCQQLHLLSFMEELLGSPLHSAELSASLAAQACCSVRPRSCYSKAFDGSSSLQHIRVCSSLWVIGRECSLFHFTKHDMLASLNLMINSQCQVTSNYCPCSVCLQQANGYHRLFPSEHISSRNKAHHSYLVFTLVIK